MTRHCYRLQLNINLINSDPFAVARELAISAFILRHLYFIFYKIRTYYDCLEYAYNAKFVYPI